MINASNFEFDGRCANDIGYYIVSFDDGNNGEQNYGDAIAYNTSRAAENPQIQIHGSFTEEAKKFSFQIMKFPHGRHVAEPILPAQQAFLKRWLQKKDGYRYLRFPEKGHEDIFYYCTIDVKWYKIGSQIYGAVLYVTCDSANGYSGIQTYERQNFQTGETFSLYNDSDDVGLIRLIQLEITAHSDGLIHLTNTMDPLYYYNTEGMKIKNCKAGETIVINGITKEIASTRERGEHTDLADDYNYNPVHLINLDESGINDPARLIASRVNTIKNEGVPCDVSLAYRTIRTGVI